MKRLEHFSDTARAAIVPTHKAGRKPLDRLVIVNVLFCVRRPRWGGILKRRPHQGKVSLPLNNQKDFFEGLRVQF